MQIRFTDTTFRYGRRSPVFENFNWMVLPGKTVILGPNGAGKTTALALAADALRPQRGRVDLDGVRDRRTHRRVVGWMPQQVRAVPGLSAREQVAYAAWLKGQSRIAAWERAAVALEQVGLGSVADRKVTQLSGGQLRRVGLAQVLAHQADVLLLDEPTVGLDPAQRAGFREILAAIPDDRTVLVSTHQVDDLSELFDRVAILDHGVIVHESTVAAFLELAPPGSARPGEVAYSSLVSGVA